VIGWEYESNRLWLAEQAQASEKYDLWKSCLRCKWQIGLKEKYISGILLSGSFDCCIY